MNPKIASASVRPVSASVRSRREAMSSAVSSSSPVKIVWGRLGGGRSREQRGLRAAAGALVAVLRGQVGADDRFESRPIGRLGVEVLALGAQLVGEDVGGDEIFLGREVRVEGAVGQAGVGHQGRHAGAVVPSCLKRRPATSRMRCRVASFWSLP